MLWKNYGKAMEFLFLGSVRTLIISSLLPSEKQYIASLLVLRCRPAFGSGISIEANDVYNFVQNL